MTSDVNNSKTIMRLLESYLHCSYRVHLGEQVVLLKIGQQQTLLDTLLQSAIKPADNWAVISGHNPGSKVQSNFVNQSANQLLEASIVKLGLSYWSLTAGDCQHDFPDEEGFLIAGINHQQLAELAIDFGQNAAVIGSVSSAARLLIFPQVWKDSLKLGQMPEFVDNYWLEENK